MNRNKEQQKYIEELYHELSFHPEQEEIIEEYSGHIRDFERESEALMTYGELVERLGAPSEIALSWKEEASVTEKRLQWLFVVCNIVLFISGALFTLGYHLFDWTLIHWLWNKLTSIPMVIVCMYFVFWALLGYEIGKAFGTRGNSLLRKTFLFGMIPNLILMGLTVFQIIPHTWFDPLITPEFVSVCILSTALLYPVTWIGFRWGRRMSL